MTAEEFTAALATIGWGQRQLAAALAYHRTQINRWAEGTSPIPEPVAGWLRAAATWHAAHPPPRYPFDAAPQASSRQRGLARHRA